MKKTIKRRTKGRYFKPHWNKIISPDICSLIEFFDHILLFALEESQKELPEIILKKLIKKGSPSIFSYYANHSYGDILSLYLKHILRTAPDLKEDIKSIQVINSLKDTSLESINPKFRTKIGRENVELFLALRALSYSLLCLVNNLRPIAIIAAEAKSGNDKSLFLLTQIDKAILNEPWVRNRIYLAQMQNQKSFFMNLARELQKNVLSKKRKDIRIYTVITLLDQANLLEKITYKQLADFLTDKEITTKAKSDSAIKMLVRNYRKSNM